MYGNIIDLCDIGVSPGKSSLFFLTVRSVSDNTLELVYPEIGW